MSEARAAVHVHSDWSYDGSWSLPRLARAFHRRRYRLVLMSEHDRGFDETRWREYRRACADASDEVLLVPGIEYSDPGNRTHVLVWGDLPFLDVGLQTGELLRRVADSGGLAVLAHPGVLKAAERFEPEWSQLLLGVELWNRKYDGFAPSRPARELLGRNPGLVEFVGLDFHSARQFFPMSMTIDVEGETTQSSVLRALSEKRCRASALGLPAARLAGGPGFAAARAAERFRRRAAKTVRRAAARRRAARG